MLKKTLKIFLLSLCTYKVAFADKLIFATEIIRHGERTASTDLINFPYEDPRGKGQLTANGITQVRDLGTQLHTTYIDTYRLLSEHYNPNEIYARSTDFDRTLMSANAFLLGLFNNTAFAIHTVPVVNDDLLLAYLKYYDEIQSLLATDPNVLKLTEELTPKLQYLSSILGESIDNLDDFFSFIDTIYIRKQFNQPLPTNLSTTEIEELYTIAQKSLAMFFHNRKIGALTSSKLLTHIKNNIDTVITNYKKIAKLHLYSTHDVTLAGFMSALGIQLNTFPSYANHISIMLFVNENEDESYYIKFLYNNNEIKVQECQTTACTLSEFNNLVANIQKSTR
jgi:lysosomal acid phosphatase